MTTTSKSKANGQASPENENNDIPVQPKQEIKMVAKTLSDNSSENRHQLNLNDCMAIRLQELIEDFSSLSGMRLHDLQRHLDFAFRTATEARPDLAKSWDLASDLAQFNKILLSLALHKDFSWELEDELRKFEEI